LRPASNEERGNQQGTRSSELGSKGPRKNNVAIVDAETSRRAALLVACIPPVCALLAPWRAGASTPTSVNVLLSRALTARPKQIEGMFEIGGGVVRCRIQSHGRSEMRDALVELPL
jgi:hypothetical protein